MNRNDRLIHFLKAKGDYFEDILIKEDQYKTGTRQKIIKAVLNHRKSPAYSKRVDQQIAEGNLSLMSPDFFITVTYDYMGYRIYQNVHTDPQITEVDTLSDIWPIIRKEVTKQ